MRIVLTVVALTVASLLAAPTVAAQLDGPTTQTTRPHPNWTAIANSEQSGTPASNAIDGNPATIWHTQYTPFATPFPHVLTIDMHANNIVAGLRYQPRTDHPNGRIGNYQIRVSHYVEGGETIVASGTFADTTAEKVVRFTPISGRYVRLISFSEAGNRGALSAAAEVDLVLNPVATLPRSGWTVTADSSQGDSPAANAIDGNPATIWHSGYSPIIVPLPHTFTIDMHASNTVSGLRYQPRTDHPNGRIGNYQIHLSTDGTTWGEPVITGAFLDNTSEKAVLFTPTAARYVRLTALTEAGNRGQYSSAAEINLINNPLSATQCASSAPIYTTLSSGAFLRYQNFRPEAGVTSWAPHQQIATWGLDARRVAAPDGVIYSAVNNGELRLRRWNGTGWDTFAGGAQYDVIDTNPVWARYVTADYFNRITVDALGDIYTVEPDGNLHWRRYDRANRTWAHRVLESNWDDRNLIVAAGAGVVYARDRIIGYLLRYEYHAESQRARSWQAGGQGWGVYSRMFSPGGDILYAIRANTGELMWYRYDPVTMTWANGQVDDEPSAMQVGAAWQSHFETVAAPNTCQLLGSFAPTRPQVDPLPTAPVTLALSSNGHLHYSYVDTEGRAVYASAADLSGGTPIRLAAVPGVAGITGTTATAEHPDGRIQIVGAGLDAEMHSNTQTATGGLWGQATSLSGFFNTPVALVRAWSTTPPIAFAIDENGLIWSRGPSPWECFDDGPNAPRLGNTHPLLVLSTGSSLRIIGQDRSGTFYARSEFNPTNGDQCQGPGASGAATGPACVCYPSWETLGGSGFAGPASAVLLSDSKLHVFATGSDGKIYTQRETATGFSRTWTEVAGGVTASGPPSATVAPDGMIKVVVRGTDNFIYHTSQTAAGSTTFTPWQIIPDSDETGTDPTALAVPVSNTWVVAYRTDLDVPRLRRYVPSTLAPSTTTAGAFVDVPMTAPV